MSAGGVVVRRLDGRWEYLAIRPKGRSRVWALPKGHIDPGEDEQSAAVREVREETGVQVALDEKLGDITYSFRTATGRIRKTVSFFLLRWESGDPVPQQEEVDDVQWLPVETCQDDLSYPGERRIALRAAEVLAERAVVTPSRST